MLDADGHVVEAGGLFDRWSPPGSVPLDVPDTTPMVPCGDFDLVADQMASGFDAPSYLRALDALGVDAAVVYPSIGLYVPFLPDLAPAESADACRAYNDWVAGWCDHAPNRLAAAGLVPLIDPDRAAKEVEHCRHLGLVAVVGRPNHLYGRNLGDPAYDPIWSTCAEAGIVLAVHEGLGLKGGSTTGMERFDTFAARHACSHPLEQQQAMASLVFEGALERHPDLRVAFLESGTGWLPWWLDRLDEHLAWMAATELSHLSLKPSEYFARQCIISTEADDHLVGHAVASVGADHVAWASDYPHPDADFPGAVGEFVTHARAGGISDDDLATILWSTPLDFYRLADRIGPTA
ncbi:MAG TPA: amidohydrolase family protein [Acidimicrobiales bacterium]